MYEQNCESLIVCTLPVICPIIHRGKQPVCVSSEASTKSDNCDLRSTHGWRVEELGSNSPAVVTLVHLSRYGFQCIDADRQLSFTLFTPHFLLSCTNCWLKTSSVCSKLVSHCEYENVSVSVQAVSVWLVFWWTSDLKHFLSLWCKIQQHSLSLSFGNDILSCFVMGFVYLCGGKKCRESEWKGSWATSAVVVNLQKAWWMSEAVLTIILYFLTLLGHWMRLTWGSWRESGLTVNTEEQWGHNSCSRSNLLRPVAPSAKVRLHSQHKQLHIWFMEFWFTPVQLLWKCKFRDFSLSTCEKKKKVWLTASSMSLKSPFSSGYFQILYMNTSWWSSKSCKIPDALWAFKNCKLAGVDSCSDASGL